jgi:glycosyltransferase involved in cell wall biosynthesis
VFLPADARVRVVAPKQLNGRRPSVSVIIPCYNYGHYLRQCVDSALSQEGVEVSVLVIDDASPDGSARVAREIASAEPRVQVVCHEVNRGNIATYNEGISMVAGDYTVLLSADDLLTPGCLARATALMEEHPSVGLVYGFPVDFTDARRPVARTRPESWIIWEGRDWIAQRCRAGRNIVRSPEVVLRTGLLHELGGYRPDLPHAADFELWMRVATAADVGFVAGADQAYYRLHSQNMHQSVYDMVDDFSQRLASFDAVFDERAAAVPEAGRLRDLAHRQVARKALEQAARDTAHRALARNALLSRIGVTSARAVGEESVDAYVEFALKAWPDAEQLSEWRVLDRLVRRGTRPRLSPSLIGRMGVRKARTQVWHLRKKAVGL